MRQEVARDQQITGYLYKALLTVATVPSLDVNYANCLTREMNIQQLPVMGQI